MTSTGWTFREGVGTDVAASMIGYDVVAENGSIGQVTEESTAVDSSYIVVDTGFWILDQKRLIPASAIVEVDHDAEQVTLAMSKNEVKDAPEYVPESRVEDDANYRDQHTVYYRPWFGIM